MHERATQRRERTDHLSEAEGQLLLRIGARALRHHVRGLPPPDFHDLLGEPVPPRLTERRGVFVTLNRHGALRGCMGSVEGRDVLWREVAAIAVLSATGDPRFPPVTEAELDTLAESVSVLTPPRPIDPAHVEIGRHGLIVRRGRHTGLLLPQVATEHGMDRETFLAHTCLKAGLPPQAWREPETELLGFEAQVFGPKPMAELD